ncbi:MAG: HD family phosphohydrolase [Eubacterium sp.]|nr:HD family phosphohydrolase [Eubacterium sp.]
MDDIDLYIELTGDLLKNELVESMKRYNHHGTIDTHFHSVYVSYTVMKICKRLNLQLRDTVRVSLLHDFYLYEWHIEKHEEMHAWYHPKESVKNIKRYSMLELSKSEEDMILRHMFPLYPLPPNSLRGWVLTLADKHCATQDYMKLSGRFVPIYNEINRRIEKL